MKIIKNLALIIIVSLLSNNLVKAAQEQNLFQVTLLRASPGLLPELIDVAKQRKQLSKNQMIIMRHSQGDHWDLMLLSPAHQPFTKHHNYQQQVDFQHTFLASSQVSWEQIKKQSKNSNLFHIEMFNAARGQYNAILKQRFMENDYLVATQRKANAVFETVFGNDVDLFTIGFYPDMQAFAAEPQLAESVFEKAAKDAGFKSRSDIGFYLRKFIVSHQDTLASHVR